MIVFGERGRLRADLQPSAASLTLLRHERKNSKAKHDDYAVMLAAQSIKTDNYVCAPLN